MHCSFHPTSCREGRLSIWNGNLSVLYKNNYTVGNQHFMFSVYKLYCSQKEMPSKHFNNQNNNKTKIQLYINLFSRLSLSILKKISVWEPNWCKKETLKFSNLCKIPWWRLSQTVFTMHILLIMQSFSVSQKSWTFSENVYVLAPLSSASAR